jgi:hypothetical protein
LPQSESPQKSIQDEKASIEAEQQIAMQKKKELGSSVLNAALQDIDYARERVRMRVFVPEEESSNASKKKRRKKVSI